MYILFEEFRGDIDKIAIFIVHQLVINALGESNQGRKVRGSVTALNREANMIWGVA